MERITLNEGVNFHGHLGPYLALGILAGETALAMLKCEKYFGLEVKVWGASEKPKSCLIDGLQLSTGATYGKGNIHKLHGERIEISVRGVKDKKEIIIQFKKALRMELERVHTHEECEEFARKLYKTDPALIFELTMGD